MAVADSDVRDVILRDGSTLRLRPPGAADVESLLLFFGRLSAGSIYRRFHGFPNLTADTVADFVDPDWDDRGALIGTLADRVVALASYVRLRDPACAEVAFAVADELQGHGVGTRLLEQLAESAAEAGIATFVAEVMPDNAPMLRVFADAGFAVSRRLEGGTTEVRLEIEPTESYRAAVDERDHVAVAASLAPFFAPRTVAVVGASTRRGSIGGELFRNILEAGFDGIAYPVNPKAPSVAGVQAYASIADIPGDVDLAVFCVPGDAVLAEAEAALKKGTRALCVISAGFAETGIEGRRRQEELLALVSAHGARLVGPNCLGIAATGHGLNATFAPHSFPAGQHRLLLAERRTWPRTPRTGGRARAGALGLCLGRQQGGRILERPARVLGGRPGDGARAALPRVVRQPAQVRAHRAARRAEEADPRHERRPHDRRPARRGLAHRRARRLDDRGRHPVPPGRASSAPTRSRSSPTSPCCSRASRSREAGGSPS